MGCQSVILVRKVGAEKTFKILENRQEVKIKMKKPILIAGILVLSASFPGLVRADYAAGVQAFQRGDYETAVRIWTPLAKQWVASAQFNVRI